MARRPFFVWCRRGPVLYSTRWPFSRHGLAWMASPAMTLGGASRCCCYASETVDRLGLCPRAQLASKTSPPSSAPERKRQPLAITSLRERGVGRRRAQYRALPMAFASQGKRRKRKNAGRALFRGGILRISLRDPMPTRVLQPMQRGYDFRNRLDDIQDRGSHVLQGLGDSLHRSDGDL